MLNVFTCPTSWQWTFLVSLYYYPPNIVIVLRISFSANPLNSSDDQVINMKASEMDIN